MANILLVVPPLTGHINPLLSVSAELSLRGHRIAWAGHSEVLRRHIPSQDQCFSLPVSESSFVDDNWHHVRGLESVKFFYEYFCLPMAELCLEPLECIVETFNPDILICDHQMIAGALVARKRGCTWVSSMTTTASILQLWHVLDDWVADKMASLQKSYTEQNIVERPDFSPFACLVFSSPELVGPDKRCFDAPYHYVGPAINVNRKPIDFPWEKLNGKKQKILISLGTVSRDRSSRFYQIMMDALGGSDLQVIMVAGRDLTGEVPNNFIICEQVPQLELLPHMDLVVSHAGHNTVCETLSYGKPMVLAPIRDDQPVIANQVVDAGAGLAIRFGKVSAEVARNTIDKVLTDSRYTYHAQRIQESFTSLGAGKQAVDVLESLLDTHDE